MKIALVAGNLHQIIYSTISYKNQVINSHAIVTSEMNTILNESIIPDKIVILDQGIDEIFEILDRQLMQIHNEYNIEIVIITRNLELQSRIKYANIEFFEQLRISVCDYKNKIDEILKLGEDTSSKPKKLKTIERDNGNKEPQPAQIKKEKISLFNKFRRPKKEEPEEDNRFKNISTGISRVIAVTGHRGVGVTSTAVNLAYEASKKNLNTIIVDLDLINRTTNLYFGEFVKQTERDEHLNSSLLKCLAKPQEYQNSACNINKNLWMTGLSYDFEDKRLLTQFFEKTKIINMLTVLRQHFNIIILDLPLEILSKVEECIPNIDCFALCVQNSQYSIITTLRNMDMYLSGPSISFLNAKSKLVISNYNDRAEYEDDFFTPEKVSEIFASDLCEELTVEMPVAGYIKSNEKFDLQIETDIPITISNSEYENYYAGIILRILEGAH